MITTFGGRAVGITGRDNHFIKAEKLLIDTPEQKGVDIGQVGTVADIDTRLVEGLVERGCIPVIAPIGVGQTAKRSTLMPTWLPANWRKNFKPKNC